jgi:hypothetical protein
MAVVFSNADIGFEGNEQDLNSIAHQSFKTTTMLHQIKILSTPPEAVREVV